MQAVICQGCDFVEFKKINSTTKITFELKAYTHRLNLSKGSVSLPLTLSQTDNVYLYGYQGWSKCSPENN